MITKLQLFKEQYHKINEGGGAGINFETKFENQNIYLTINKGKIEYESTLIKSNEFTITGEGYDDGGTFSGQLEIVDQIPTNINKITEILKHVTISDLIYSVGEEDVFKGFPLVKNMNTHTSIFDYSFKESVEIYVELDFLYKEMKFGGWSRGTLEAGNAMFTSEDIDLNEYSRIYFNDCEFMSSVKEKPQSEIAFGDLYSLFVPNIIISEELASWYDSVFINPESDDDEDWEEEFESKLNENETKLKGLLAYVYRNNLGDGTGNGVSSKYDQLILVDENLVGNGPFDSNESNNEDVLVIVHDTIMSESRVRAIPYNIYINKQHSMFGGNFIYTSHSSMPTKAPIKIFDRIENN